MLARQAMDVAVGAFGGGPAWMRATPLRSMRFCCVHQPGLAPSDGPWSIEAYAALPHLMVTYRSALEGTVDKALARHGLQRDILCTSPRFSSLPRVLQRVPAVATVPEVLGPLWAEAFGLVVQPAPLALPGIDVRVTRHASRDHDAGLQWLCDTLVSVAAAQ